jgi:hypothetical protein
MKSWGEPFQKAGTTMKNPSESLTLKVGEAVTKVARHVQGGMAPTDALAKTARELQLQPGYVKLAANAYNTGMQAAQQQSGDTVLDKLAEFPLADADAATEQVWGPQKVEKVSQDYGRPPSWLGPREKAAKAQRLNGLIPGVEKTAEAKSAGEPQWGMTRAYNKVSGLKRRAQLAKFAAGESRDRLLSALGALGDYCKLGSHDRMDLRDMEWNATVQFGDEVTPLFDFVRTRNGSKEAGVNLKSARVRAMEVDPTQHPWCLVHNCIKAAQDVLGAQQAAKEADQEYETKGAEILAPYGGIPGRQTKEAARGGGAFFGSMLGTSLAGARGLGASQRGKADEAVQKGLLALDDPEHMSRLRGIQAEAMLQDLMTNDEVISGHDPEHVLGVYNELSQLMPEASMQPAVMRSALRERLTTEPATFEAGQLADIESKVRESRQPPAIQAPAAPDPYGKTQ